MTNQRNTPSQTLTYADQLTQWADGKSVHGDQCVPDFSCCEPHLKAPDAERRLFVERPELREQLCMGYLGRALAALGRDKEVHVAGSIQGNA